ncbi:MAG: creatininase [Rhodospirillaceae bacterium]|nr:creatininase [Rhodospirillaceae bacterium]
MSRKVLIEEMTWTEYDRVLREERPAVLVPVGALEQHGPHLPMNCDTAIPAAIARAVAGRVSALVAPPLAYGYKSQPKSGGGNHFPGTTSLDGQTLTLQVRDVTAEFARHGVRKLAFMVGHYENTMFVVEGIDLALRDLRARGVGDMKVLRIDYWEFTGPATLDKVFPDGFPGWPLEHAAVMETSVMLHLNPELVDMGRVPSHPPVGFPPYDVYPFDPARGTASGALSSAAPATAEKGRLLFEEYVAGIAAALQKEFSLEPVAGAAGPMLRRTGS